MASSPPPPLRPTGGSRSPASSEIDTLHRHHYSSSSPPLSSSSSQLRRKPLPQHANPVVASSGPSVLHPSSPLSIEGDNKPTLPTSTPVARPPSPVSVGDSPISLPRNPNRYVCMPIDEIPSPLIGTSFKVALSPFSVARVQREIKSGRVMDGLHALPLPQTLEDPSSLTRVALLQILAWSTFDTTTPH